MGPKVSLTLWKIWNSKNGGLEDGVPSFRCDFQIPVFLVERGVSPQNLLFGYETTNHCITKSSTRSISVHTDAAESDAYSAYQASKLQKIPTKIAVFCQSPSPQLVFYSHRNPGRHPSFTMWKRLRNVECHRRKAICLAKSIGTS